MNVTIDPHRFLQEIYAEQGLPVPLVFKVAGKITAAWIYEPGIAQEFRGMASEERDKSIGQP